MLKSRSLLAGVVLVAAGLLAPLPSFTTTTGGYQAPSDPWNPRATDDPAVARLSYAEQVALNDHAADLVHEFERRNLGDVQSFDADGTRNGAPYPVTLSPVKSLPGVMPAYLASEHDWRGSWQDDHGFVHVFEAVPSVEISETSTKCRMFYKAYHYVGASLRDGANFGVNDLMGLYDYSTTGHPDSKDFSVTGVASTAQGGIWDYYGGHDVKTEPIFGLSAQWSIRGSDGSLHYATDLDSYQATCSW